MKRRRRTIVLVIAFALVALWLAYPPTDHRFGKPYYDRITDGMSEADVETVLGLPAGDYRPERWIHPGHFVSPREPIGDLVKGSGISEKQVSKLEQEDFQDWCDKGMPVRPFKVTRKQWLGRTWGINVVFDENRRVIRRELLGVVPPPAPNDLFAKLKWYIGF
jgi:hypothetical protein